MIQGKTTLHLSVSDMHLALEHWLNGEVLKNKIEVTSIKKEPNGIDTGFSGDVIPKDETEAE